MKYLLLLLLPAMPIILSCTEEEQQVTTNCDVGYHENDLIRLPDGQEIRITDVNDNYCPCNVQCVWAGYLEVIVQVEGANRGPDTLGWPDRVVTVGENTLRLGEIYDAPPCGGSIEEEAFCFEVVVE